MAKQDGAAIGRAIDLYFRARAERLAQEREVQKLKAREQELQDAVKKRLLAENLDKAAGSLGSLSLEHTRVPQVQDWEKFYAWIHRHKAFDVLQRRVHEGHFAEHLEADPRLAKRGVPGVEQVPVVKVTASAKRGAV